MYHSSKKSYEIVTYLLLLTFLKLKTRNNTLVLCDYFFMYVRLISQSG